MFRLYAVLGTTRPSAIEDKFNFLLSGAFDSYRLSVFWFGTNSLGLGKREEDLQVKKRWWESECLVTLIAEQLKNHKSTPAVL